MSSSKKNSRSSKISAAFKARLDRLQPTQRVRVILLLHTMGVGTASGRRQGGPERQAAIDVIRQAAESVLKEIDDVLKRYDGARLASGVNALGAVSVETTAAGIAALAALEEVKAIVEDQPVLLRH